MTKAKLEATTYKIVLLVMGVAAVTSKITAPVIYRWLLGLGLPHWAIVAIGAVVVIYGAGTFMKLAVLLAMPNSYGPVPVQPEQVANVDYPKLVEWTASFESLGFEKLMDYRLEDEVAKLPPGFARLFVNRDRKCFAEINQIFPTNAPATPIGCVVMSRFDDGWSLSTTNRKPSGTTWVIRRPKGVWSSHRNAAPADLLATHLEWRREMESELGAHVSTETTPDSYMVEELSCTAQQRRIWKRKIIWVALAEILVFNIRPKTEWRGLWARAANTSPYMRQ